MEVTFLSGTRWANRWAPVGFRWAADVKNVLGKDDNLAYEELFFESGGCFVRHYDNQASGNPVKIGDGYATVTGYKLP